MNNLLIHSNNINQALIDSFSENDIEIRFTNQTTLKESYSFDAEVYNLLKVELAQKEYETIFITLNLDGLNYLSLLGLRVALMLRLSPELGHSRCPIIFLCQESKEQIATVSNYGGFLFTPKIHFSSSLDHQELLNEVSNRDNDPLTDTEYNKFIKLTSVNAPSNYDSAHSISNEWTIHRWINMSDNVTDEVKENVISNLPSVNNLHFKFKSQCVEQNTTRQKFRNKHKKDMEVDLIENESKIFYIDDEISKGWGELFKNVIFHKYYENDRYETFEEFDQNLTKNELLNNLKSIIKTKIQDEGFNFFIIDLRLHIDDQNNNTPSGLELIELIKAENKGIEILIFTASQNAKIANRCFELGASSFVSKESPDEFNSRNDSYDLFIEFNSKAKKCIENSINSKLVTLTKEIQTSVKTNSIINKNFKNHLTLGYNVLDKIYDLTTLQNGTLINFSLLEVMNLFEKIANESGVLLLSSNNSLKVQTRENTVLDIYFKDGSKEISAGKFIPLFKSKITFDRGKYSFQTTESRETNKRVLFNDEWCTIEGYKLDSFTILKIFSLLKFHCELDKINYNKFIELRYLRSNIAAHDTGNVNKKSRVILKTDIVFLLETLKETLDNVTYYA